ncbi:hypothetical protein H9Y04_33030 [Streptomyces sp. TRM66268-LWL]|uniref:Uncharacterized protein n=1 Tax=Streptomyces polyasparticus TaxID=2767826 RepID=A0ABR7SPS5_9ACTN|nr:hypothetical protein [Streptomyces polyasparticus]MBC9717364.1 hypothetical protein [Streptomyces polyasparticus]
MLPATEARTSAATGDDRLALWLRVREFAVPPTMIDTATVRREAGDWAGACAAARVDVDLDPRDLARTYGDELARRLRSDLRYFAPDLLRWHMPRVGPDGLLRPGVTSALARYETGDPRRPLHLVVRTPPAWADAGQRISLTVWDGALSGGPAHPHPRPSPRFRFDLHRHLWDARRAGELAERAGSGGCAPDAEPHWAVDRWAVEARLVREAEGLAPDGLAGVRVGGGRCLAFDTREGCVVQASGHFPLLPDAATWVPPDRELLRAGLIDGDRLHPLVAEALGVRAPQSAAVRESAGHTHLVDCRGERHRVALVDGVLSPLDHEPAEIHRESLLAALGGPPMPCLQVIDEAHRDPVSLPGIRERLAHGDYTGALDVVEDLLGRDARLGEGPLRDALETAVSRRIDHGLYRSGLGEPGGSGTKVLKKPRSVRSHPRQAPAR